MSQRSDPIILLVTFNCDSIGQVYFLCILLSVVRPSSKSSNPLKRVPPQLDELEVTNWNLKFLTFWIKKILNRSKKEMSV